MDKEYSLPQLQLELFRLQESLVQLMQKPNAKQERNIANEQTNEVLLGFIFARQRNKKHHKRKTTNKRYRYEIQLQQRGYATTNEHFVGANNAPNIATPQQQ